ncbi:hypothetical protein LXL04_022513 [Taraxacum kok-saghyz]
MLPSLLGAYGFFFIMDDEELQEFPKIGGVLCQFCESNHLMPTPLSSFSVLSSKSPKQEATAGSNRETSTPLEAIAKQEATAKQGAIAKLEAIAGVQIRGSSRIF